MSNNIKEVKEEEFSNEVINSGGVVLVDFYADWCGPCKRLYPVLEELDKEMQGQVKIVKCNIEENIKAVKEFNINSVPTISIFKNGLLSKHIVGLRTKQDIRQDLEVVLNEG